MWLDAFHVRKTKPFYSNVSEDQKTAGFFHPVVHLQPHRCREYKLKDIIFSYHIQLANSLSLTRKRAL